MVFSVTPVVCSVSPALFAVAEVTLDDSTAFGLIGATERRLINFKGDMARIAFVIRRRHRHNTAAVANQANQGPALELGIGSLDQRNNICKSLKL